MKKSGIHRIYHSPLDLSFYEDEQKPQVSGPDVKIIAFYLPQYHPIPENDQFWGKGFTEWTNVSKALPVFEGHYQPRLPGELGFYDVRIKDVMRRQIELLKQYGLYGLCFHHYWFSGKRILRVPYDTIMADKSLDVHFCLHWANEPWTASWDGCLQGSVLLAQNHDPDDDMAFIKDILPALRDERYIRIDGRPLLIVYRPRLFPNMRDTVERWQEFCHREGLGGLYLAMMQTSFEGEIDPATFEFDAAIEYPPHNTRVSDITSSIRTFDPNFKGRMYDYREMVRCVTQKPEPPYKLFRGITSEWDCTPRRDNPDIFVNASPAIYQEFLEKQIANTKQSRTLDEKFIFVNAWNEWAEGAYLEPDRKYGYAYLNATHRAINHKYRIAVMAHLYYKELFPEIIGYLKNIPQIYDLYVTTTPRLKMRLQKLLEQHFSTERLHIMSIKNRGRDVAGFVGSFAKHYFDYDFICKINDKKSLGYGRDLKNWRKYLLKNVLGSFESVQKILSMFEKDKKLGIIYPEHYPPIHNMVEWGSNYETTKELLRRIGVEITPDTPLEYPSGFMFWFRPEALAALFKLGLRYQDFDEELGQLDGTLAHAIERSILFVAESQGYGGKTVCFYKGIDDSPHKDNLVLRYSLKKKPITLFGAGTFGREILARLRDLDFNVCRILDNDPARWGRTLDGIRIVAPEKYDYGSYILIASQYYEEIKKQLTKMGLVEHRDFLFVARERMLDELNEFAGSRAG
jgi:lipopolysaccharide biosynthesis protein